MHFIKYPIQYILRYYDDKSPNYKQEIFDEGSPYDFEYFQWFVPCLKDKDTANKLTAILCQNPTDFMELDYAKSDNDYVHLPCDAIDSPNNIIYPAVKDLVDESLDYLIRQQNDDGCWHLHWRFGEGEAFAKIQALFEAHLTCLILAALGRFGRIEL